MRQNLIPLATAYFPTIPIAVHRMEIFYYSAAQPNGGLLKLLIQGHVQAKSESCLQWRKWRGAAALEWKKIQGGIQLHKMYVLDTGEKNDPMNTV